MKEFFKIWVLNKIHKIKKPLILVNIDKLFDPFIEQLYKLTADGFIKQSELAMIQICNNITDLAKHLSI